MNSPPTARLVIVASLLIFLIVAGALALAACGKTSTATNASSSPSQSVTQTHSTPGVGTIAFTKSSNGTEHEEIYLVRTDGSGLRQLTHSVTGSVSRPAWSPAGGKIAYLTGGKRRGTHSWSGTVWVVNADGSGAYQLDPGGYGQEGSVTGVAWSPDGRQLVLTRVVPGGTDLAVMNADGSGFRILEARREELAHYDNPVWSPTGRIFFTRTSASRKLGAVCSINPDGSDLTDVTVLPARSVGAAFLNAVFSLSQDGRWLALVDRGWGLGAAGESRIGYMTANGLGGENVLLEAKRLTTLRGENRLRFRRWPGALNTQLFIGASSWSPDGTRIAFVGGFTSGFLGARALYIVRIDGSGLRKVPNTEQVTHAAWQPQ